MSSVPSFVKRMDMARAKRQVPETVDRQVKRQTLPAYDVTRHGGYGWCRETLERHDSQVIKVLAAYFSDLNSQG